MTANGEQAPLPGESGSNELTQEEKNWGMFCHLVAFAGVLIPLGNLIGPLVVWLIKKNEMPFVDYNGKEAVNFQISFTIYALISAVFIFIFIGFLLIIAVAIAAIILTIIAAIKASNGEHYQYPYIFRFIK